MKTLNQITLLLFCLGFLNGSYAQQDVTQKKNPIVIIDPGHGGKDAGAIGVNGIQEKSVVLNIASEILKLNNELENPLNIYLSRYSDTLISLSDRTKLAKAIKADFFMSLHCNHSDNSDARGIEVYIANIEEKHSKESVWLAFKLQDILNKKLGFESRGVKFANFQVLRETTNYCTSMLLELGFLSNWDEGNYIAGSVNIKLIASAILKSIEL